MAKVYRKLVLRRYQIRQTPHLFLHGFRLRLEVVEAVGMPAEIFIFRQHPVNVNTGEIINEFLTVASFPDLAEYPANAPDFSKALPFFRMNCVELDVRGIEEFNWIVDALIKQVGLLRYNLDQADNLVFKEEITFEGDLSAPYSETSTSSESILYGF